MKKNSTPKSLSNRRARFDYELGDSLLVGLQLSGAETKALRLGHGSLQGAYVTVKNSAKGGELWLINALISSSSGIPISESDQTRARKLLAKRGEITKLIAAKDNGQTIIPLEILTRGHFIKLRIATGRGRRKFDKRQVLKKRDELRQIKRVVKS